MRPGQRGVATEYYREPQAPWTGAERAGRRALGYPPRDGRGALGAVLTPQARLLSLACTA